MTVRLGLGPKRVGMPRRLRMRGLSLAGALRRRCWKSVLALLILVWWPALCAPRTAPGERAGRNPSVDPAARPCKAAKETKRSKGAGKNSRRKGEAGADVVSCIEVRSTALEVQEFLQAYGRDQKWSLLDEHVGEDGWTFTRRLEKDELLSLTKKDANAEGVNWTSGESFVQVETLELDGGYVRVRVTARYRGHGQSSDRFAPPKEYWELSSNFGFENQLISALETHMKNVAQ